MSIRIKRRWVLVISCLIVSGCTEKTIIREVPASSEPEAGVMGTLIPGGGSLLTPTTAGSNMVTAGTDTDTGQLQDALIGGGSNMVAVEPDTDIDPDTDTDTDTDTEIEIDTGIGQLEDPLSAAATVENITGTTQLQDLVDASVSGEPGVGVDCNNTLPCRWISADSQISMSVTNADNFGSRERLQLNYTLETSHDTQISVTSSAKALDDAGMEFQPGVHTLGSRVSGNAQTLLAGSTLDGTLVFNQGTASTTLTEWSVTLLDGGSLRSPKFTNIPVGPVTTAYADCELVLPCVWLTPQGNVSITLTSAGGYSTNSRLSTTFTVQSTTTINVALDAGAIAIGSEGTEFTGRTHSLGSIRGYAKITATADSGYDLTGVVEYYRNTAEPTALSEVSLALYQDSPVPRWNPKFVNVPAQ